MWLEVCKLFERLCHSESTYVLFKWHFHLYFWLRNFASRGCRITLKFEPRGLLNRAWKLENQAPGAPKLSSGGSREPLGKHLGQKIGFSMLWGGPWETKMVNLAFTCQKRPKTVPTLSQMDPETLSNPFFKAIFWCFYSYSKFTSTFDGLFGVFFLIFQKLNM